MSSFLFDDPGVPLGASDRVPFNIARLGANGLDRVIGTKLFVAKLVCLVHLEVASGLEECGL